MSDSFFDTNVLLYVLSNDSAKAERADQLVKGGGTISVQVPNEFASAARRKLKLTWPTTLTLLQNFRELLDVRPVTLEVHEVGLDLARRYQLSIYDSMIAAAAVQAGCDTLWSEDMHDGLLIGGQLRIMNPFRPA